MKKRVVKIFSMVLALSVAISQFGFSFQVQATQSGLLLWDDFCFYDSTTNQLLYEAADGTLLTDGLEIGGRLNTGAPLNGGWKSYKSVTEPIEDWDTSGWRNGSAAKVINTKTNAAVTPLKYGQLANSGVFAQVDSSSGNALRSIQTNGQYAPASDGQVIKDYVGNSGGSPYGIGGVDGKTLWFSALMRQDGNYSGGSGYIAFSLGGDEQIQVGFFNDSGKVGVNRNWGIKYKTGVSKIEAGSYTDGGSFDYVISDAVQRSNETYLIVVKLDFNGSTTTNVTAYINPVKDQLGELGNNVVAPESAAEISVDFTSDKLFRFDAVKLGYGLWASNGPINFGEFRFGENFASVTPIDPSILPDEEPEPEPEPGEGPDLLLWQDFTYENNEVFAGGTFTMRQGQNDIDLELSPDSAVIVDLPDGRIAPATNTSIPQNSRSDIQTGGPLGPGWATLPYHTNFAEFSKWTGAGNDVRILNTHQDGDATIPGSFRPPMNYGNLTTSGVYLGRGYHSYQNYLIRVVSHAPSNTGNPRALAFKDYLSSGGVFMDGSGDIIGGKAGTLWYSALIRRDAEHANNLTAFAAFGSTHSNNSRGQLYIGYFPGPEVTYSKYGDIEAETITMPSEWAGGHWGAKYRVGSQGRDTINNIAHSAQEAQYKYVMSDKPVVTGETVLIVVKIEFDNETWNADTTGYTEKDKATIWFNPDVSSLGGEQPTGGNKIEVEFPADKEFLIRSFGFGLNGAESATLGDMRVGKTYASVTPTEPYPPTEIKMQGNKLMSITYDSNEAPNPTIITSLYSNQGGRKLLKSEVLNNPATTPVKLGIVSVDLSGLDVVCGANQQIKVFVWDSTENIQPAVTAEYVHPAAGG